MGNSPYMVEDILRGRRLNSVMVNKNNAIALELSTGLSFNII
jgi:hypothetical protein